MPAFYDSYQNNVIHADERGRNAIRQGKREKIPRMEIWDEVCKFPRDTFKIWDLRFVCIFSFQDVSQDPYELTLYVVLIVDDFFLIQT